ncbi:hypothetical protein NIE88_09090 [Sporolactobacillus shoreicorticis]|uniref:Major facilitator superfamily (MFS) profile domain-containing protein n=1 Tax=Sporolactobacillus shoreicorticis TaxID=1923877 RepID=A0ABW5S9K0_9BACL|nr:hypothetical protein [Sporolactobacillus shoreicorticis]MCO7125927.1 hypothetical protein [Sporolactobacillus shoreicorticis]
MSYALGFGFWLSSALMPNISLKVILFAISMVPIGLTNILNFVMMQNIIPENLLARSISVMVSISTCIMPVGSLIGGSLSALLSPATIFTATSASLLFIAVYICCVPILRSIPSIRTVRPEEYGFQPTSIAQNLLK